MKRWAIQDAKARFSEVLRAAVKEPQWISNRGRDTAVVVSADQFCRLSARQKTNGAPKDLADVLRRSPRVPEFELPPRGFEPMRRVDFG